MDGIALGRLLLLGCALLALASVADAAGTPTPPSTTRFACAEPTKEWLTRWEANILGEAKGRSCDKEMGEEIGWLVTPILDGFYYGYLATKDTRWLDRLVDWTDSWTRRAVKEPDGFTGWPKEDGASTTVVSGLYTDNILGEAMGLRSATLLAALVKKMPSLRKKYGEKAAGYLALSEQVFRKWDQRGCWREVKGGGLWVVPTFGIDRATGKWTEGYARKGVDGFSLPANKQNHVARWLLALNDATGKPLYKERAEKWFRLMKSRMREREGGRYLVWNYWDPAGPWDFNADGSTKHWVGVHPNGGYYGIDVEGIVAAYQHGLVFTQADIDRLIATNRDFMWNQRTEGAKFERIDGGKPDDRWKDTPGVLWSALAPYDETLRDILEANLNPASWGGLAQVPWYVSVRKAKGGS
ncbi:MAG TPA: hypothetical protein VGN26_03170 [Armatimonadota bacterium]|jgi:hypothetical protein